MREMESVSEALIAWTKEHSLIGRSIEGFFNYFKHYQEEEPEEFAHYFPNFEQSRLEIREQSISLRASLVERIPTYIIVRLNILFNGEEVGKYSISYTWSGEVLDDAFYDSN
jgi:hypothetical protein